VALDGNSVFTQLSIESPKKNAFDFSGSTVIDYTTFHDPWTGWKARCGLESTSII